MSNSGIAGEKKQTEKPASDERRKQARFACDGFAEVVVDNAGFLFRGKIQDFSLAGCYIQSVARLNVECGAEVDLRFSVEGEYFSLRALLRIVRSGAGAGFEFIVDDTQTLRRLATLGRRLAPPAAAETPCEQSDLAASGTSVP